MCAAPPFIHAMTQTRPTLPDRPPQPLFPRCTSERRMCLVGREGSSRAVGGREDDLGCGSPTVSSRAVVPPWRLMESLGSDLLLP